MTVCTHQMDVTQRKLTLQLHVQLCIYFNNVIKIKGIYNNSQVSSIFSN